MQTGAQGGAGVGPQRHALPSAAKSLPFRRDIPPTIGQTNYLLLKPRGPSFSFPKAPRATQLTSYNMSSSEEESYESSSNDDEYETESDEDHAGRPNFSLVERRAPAASFGTAPTGRGPLQVAHKSLPSDDSSQLDSEDESTSECSGPAQPLFAPFGSSAKRWMQGDLSRRSSISSSILSDAPTEFANPAEQADSLRERAPSARITSRSAPPPPAMKMRARAMEARLGPGSYTPSIDAVKPKAAGPTFARKPTIARTRRKQVSVVPGPGSYNFKSSLADAVKSGGGGSWSRQTGRESPRPKDFESTPEKVKGAELRQGCSVKQSETSETHATKPQQSAKNDSWTVVKPRPRAVVFGSAPRMTVTQNSTAADTPPFYVPNYALVEPNPRALTMRPPSATTRRTPSLHELKVRWSSFDKLLRGGFSHLHPMAPADALRKRIAGFRIMPPTDKSRSLGARRQRHHSVPLGTVSPPLQPQVDALSTRERGTVVIFSRMPRAREISVSPVPGPGAYEDARARVAVLPRAPAASLAQTGARSGNMLQPSKSRVMKKGEGDTLVLEILRALDYLKPELPTIRFAMSVTKPRLRPFLRLPPLPQPWAPISIFPPRQVPSAFFSAPRYSPLADERGINVPIERLFTPSALEYSPNFSSVEPRILHGTISQAPRLESLTAAAALLPEGCVLVLQPNHDAILPRHSTLVNMSSATRVQPINADTLPPPPTAYTPSDAITRPHVPSVDFNNGLILEDDQSFITPCPGSYDPQYQAVRPAVPAHDFSRGSGRLAQPETSSMIPEGDAIWLAFDPSVIGRANLTPSGGALDFARQTARKVDALPIDERSYSVQLHLVTPRPFSVDFASAPPMQRDGQQAPYVPEGDMLRLEPRWDAIEFSAPAFGFGSAAREASSDSAPLPEGSLLHLSPKYELEHPHHGTLVDLRPPPREVVERRKERRRKAAARRRVEGGLSRVEREHLCDIESALAAAGRERASVYM